MSNLHAHYSATATDCDGTHNDDYILEQSPEERAQEFGHLAFQDRVVSLLTSVSVERTGRLHVTYYEQGNILEWTEGTDEGGIYRKARFCSQDCVEPSTTAVYVTGVPLTVSVDEHGRVTFDFDLSEVTDKHLDLIEGGDATGVIDSALHAMKHHHTHQEQA